MFLNKYQQVVTEEEKAEKNQGAYLTHLVFFTKKFSNSKVYYSLNLHGIAQYRYSSCSPQQSQNGFFSVVPPITTLLFGYSATISLIKEVLNNTFCSGSSPVVAESRTSAYCDIPVKPTVTAFSLNLKLTKPSVPEDAFCSC